MKLKNTTMKTKKKLRKTSQLEWDSPETDLQWDLEDPVTLDPSSSPIEPKAGSSKFSKALAKMRPSFKLTPSNELGTRIEGRKGRKGKRLINVTIEYDPKKAGYAHGLHQGDLFREIIAARGIIDEDFNTEERVGHTFYSLGKLPAWILAGDVDRFHYFIYAAEMLRANPDWAKNNVGLKELRENHCQHCGCDRHPQKKDIPDVLSIWGDVDPPKPVREQMATAKTDLIDRTRSEAVPAQPVEDTSGPAEAYLGKWVMAEKRAKQPREQWEGKVDFEFEAMIKYCYGWLKDIGEVPQPYPMGTIDLFWQRPRPGQLKMSNTAVQRRNFITYKVMKFWRKSMSQDGVKEQIELGRSPLSYRVVLAAQRLATVIEWYADPDPIHGKTEEDALKLVRKAANRYFKAHFPIATEGAKPGPLATSDPGYVEYIQLCRKYKLKEGQLLHEAEL